MKIIESVEDIQLWSQSKRGQGQSVGFVPTMGALHEGHLSLMRRSLSQADVTVGSLFVNPTQFGVDEDLDAYPRLLEDDMNKLADLGVNVVFCPEAQEVYPQDFKTWVEVPSLAQHLCGASRPGHFRGVCTVVSIFFNLVRPTWAYFGEKDFQQLRIIEQMVQDLRMGVNVVVCPTIREPNGLAMSSRNAYLSPEQRENAGMIYQALVEMRQHILAGETQADAVLSKGRAMLDKAPGLTIDYLEVVDYNTLLPVSCVEHAVIVAVSVCLGLVRLIDHIDVKEI